MRCHGVVGPVATGTEDAGQELLPGCKNVKVTNCYSEERRSAAAARWKPGGRGEVVTIQSACFTRSSYQLYQLVNGKLQGKTTPCHPTPLHPRNAFHTSESEPLAGLGWWPSWSSYLSKKVSVCLAKRNKAELCSAVLLLSRGPEPVLIV